MVQITQNWKIDYNYACSQWYVQVSKARKTNNSTYAWQKTEVLASLHIDKKVLQKLLVLLRNNIQIIIDTKQICKTCAPLVVNKLSYHTEPSAGSCKKFSKWHQEISLDTLKQLIHLWIYKSSRTTN